jgi:hypothetical protein
MIEGTEMNHGKHRKHQFAIVFSASVLMLSLMAMGTAHASTPTYSNGFETDTAGWVDGSDPGFPGFGSITRQPSGYLNPGGYASGIPSAAGGFHARLDRGECDTDNSGGGGPTVYCPGPFTRWGGYNKTWNGGWETQVDVYLDTTYAQANADSYSGNLACLTADSTDPSCKGTRFDYSSAVNNTQGNFIRDFGFNVATGPDLHGNLTCSGFFATAGMNINRSGADAYSQGNTKCIPGSGWYTFKHTFYADSGFLNVRMQIIPVGSTTPTASWNVVSPDPISSGDPTKDVGCNRYGWFTNQEIYGLAIDNAEMSGGCGKTSPTIETTLSASGGIKGDTIHDSATLTGETSDAGGTVNYRYYASTADCTADTTGTAGTDVSTETVTNGTVPNSADETFTTAGTFYWAAFYSGDARNNPAKSDCASEPLEIVTQVGKITPTGTTCPQYQGLTAATLGQVRYTVTRGGAIGSVSPGVFFYYTRVTGSTGDTVAITQSHTGIAPTIPIQQRQVLLFSDPGCATLKWKTLTVTGGTATGTLPSTGSFIISVKYDTSSLKGKAAPDPTTSTYTFGTNHNGPILADIARVDLVKK